ncbi:MAG: nuclear transport factor 2 family protein [Ignavibacteriaceae bacterium]
MREINKVLSVSIILSFLCTFSLNAQQWTDAQKEVWATVKAYNDISAKGDTQGFISYFDDSYCGWSYILDAPIEKDELTTAIKYWLANSKTLYYTITPAKIWVNGDFAFVHYYYTSYTENKEGKKEWEKGRWTDILMKKDGKWVMVGDHGGKTSD